jgi:hypothetical protein
MQAAITACMPLAPGLPMSALQKMPSIFSARAWRTSGLLLCITITTRRSATFALARRTSEKPSPCSSRSVQINMPGLASAM